MQRHHAPLPAGLAGARWSARGDAGGAHLRLLGRGRGRDRAGSVARQSPARTGAAGARAGTAGRVRQPARPDSRGRVQQPGGIQGTYVLTQINNSQPGQLVTVANPDGIVVGLYRFDAATTLTLDPLQTFALELHYSDDKSEYSYDDHGEFKSPGAVEGTLALTFYSDDYGDQFSGIAVDGTVAIQYDFDGDGQTETTFGFQRIN